MGLLKGVAIILPVLFLAVMDTICHLLFPSQLHSVAGLIGFYVITAAAVALFAHTIFRIIGGLQQKVSDQNRELSALLSVGQVVTSSLNLDDLLTRSLNTIIAVTPAQAAEVWLMEGPDELVLRCHQGAYRGPLLERATLGVGEGLPGRAAQRREPVISQHPSTNGTFIRQDAIAAGLRAVVVLPLQYQAKLVGGPHGGH